MKRIPYFMVVMVSIMGLSPSVLQAQLKGLHGDDREYRLGVHAGNNLRTGFFNDGTIGGRVNQPPEVAGEWPKNTGRFYLIDGNPLVLSEETDVSGSMVHVLSTVKSVNVSQTRGPRDPVTGEWWTFLPLRGFANPNNTRAAMAKGNAEWPNSWPPFWPDIADPKNPYKIYSPDGWAGSWNGYFGRDVFNADEESYFVSDDYANKVFSYFPDSTDHNRRGLGLRMYVRGFQWNKAAVKDGIFWLFDLESIGTYGHDKMVFGFKVGNNMGESTQGSDAGDDNAAYSREEDIAYMWDNDNLGAGNWSPVGLLGGAFLESPGNPYDGIDNDNDGRNGSGSTISEAMFQPKALNLTDGIVLINYADPKFPRTVTTLADTLARLGKTPQDTLEVHSGQRVLKLWAGKDLQEVGDNLFDDNLNGVIDENRGRQDQAGVFHYLYIGDDGVGYKCVDYFTGAGKDNLLLDERRDDGIDNDGDWAALTDDTGADGLAPGASGYVGPDLGEKDGLPTSGEPHFDKTDVDESDMIGLTSFYLYDWGTVFQYDPEMMWNGLAPGFFNYTFATANVELLYGSGYFPLVPGQVERFSMAILCAGLSSSVLAEQLADLVRHKQYFAQAYNQNYNFAKAPNIPTVRAVAGDNRVTLFWDSFAETSIDPIGDVANDHRDFEGYKIYRSTDPGFNDATPITDAYGSLAFRIPIAQFDLDNDYSGLAVDATQGVQFNLGSNTGLRHFWVDTTAVNGYTYFYVVTSYDHGDPILGIDPSECTIFVALSSTGEIEKGTNVAVVRPEAPVAGYTPGKLKDSEFIPGPNNAASGTVNFAILDNTTLKDGDRYGITFKSTLSTNRKDSTASLTLVNLTTNTTLLEDSPLQRGSEGLPVTEGFQLSFSNNPAELDIDTLRSSWSKPGIPAYNCRPFVFREQPVRNISADFEIVFSDVGVDTSKTFARGTEILPPIPVNFTVINKQTNKKVPFAFRERAVTPGDSGKFTYDFARRRSDEIIFLANPDSQIASWQVMFLPVAAATQDTTMPGPGDVLTLTLNKPFLSNDTFEFSTVGASIDADLAKAGMDRIRVVPNPYIVTNSWEPTNPYSSGRGERKIHFTHLPAQCTIRIFNVRGQLVNALEHNSSLNDGTEIWNMLSKDNLEISYGIYIYHIKADGVGEKTGKFVVLK